MAFALHPQLASDCATLGGLSICRMLLMNNRHFPWLVLVPQRKNMRELFDLSAGDYQVVMEEVRTTAQKFCTLTGADKMNIAALGNMVPQLHIHIIARFTDDAAWPNPVWNSGVTPEPYVAEELAALLQKLRQSVMSS